MYGNSLPRSLSSLIVFLPLLHASRSLFNVRSRQVGPLYPETTAREPPWRSLLGSALLKEAPSMPTLATLFRSK